VHVGVLYDTDLMPFERTLAPGSEFKTAAVSLLTFRNRDGFSDPHWVLPSYTASVLRRKIVARGTPWIYNTWEPFERNINRETTLQLIDVAAAMGWTFLPSTTVGNRNMGTTPLEFSRGHFSP
jgi:alpha-galactosidase